VQPTGLVVCLSLVKNAAKEPTIAFCFALAPISWLILLITIAPISSIIPSYFASKLLFFFSFTIAYYYQLLLTEERKAKDALATLSTLLDTATEVGKKVGSFFVSLFVFSHLCSCSS
jgi:hypothetical protein